MRLRLFAMMALASLTAAPASRAEVTGAIDPPLSPRNASYVIDATLDPSSRTITGSEVILWRNITTRPATELQFHLYWNAWRDDRSTWLREAKLGSRRAVPVVSPDERLRARTKMSVTSRCARSKRVRRPGRRPGWLPVREPADSAAQPWIPQL